MKLRTAGGYVLAAGNGCLGFLVPGKGCRTPVHNVKYTVERLPQCTKVRLLPADDVEAEVEYPGDLQSPANHPARRAGTALPRQGLELGTS